jgi:hypothetical protein
MQYIVKTLAVTGFSNKIHHSGAEVSDADFPSGVAERMLQSGHLRYKEIPVSKQTTARKRQHIDKPIIGIGITTCGRKDVFQKTMVEIGRFAPAGAVIFVNDDKDKEGVAISKNKCLAALDHCDYIFLFDDDIYPVKAGWHLPYIKAYEETGNEHLCLIYDKFANGWLTNNAIKNVKGDLVYHHHPAGVLLFFTKRCIEMAGGMDCNYSPYGDEHCGFSLRIHNMGLTEEPYISVKNTMQYFHCLDYHLQVQSTVLTKERTAYQDVNNTVLAREKEETGFKPYKKSDYVLSIYLTGAKLRYAGFPAKANIDSLSAWAYSLTDKDMTGIIFHNCFTDEEIESFSDFPVKFIKVDPPKDFMSGLYRYELYADFIKRFGRYIDTVWCTDSTDLTVLKNPAKEKPVTEFINIALPLDRSKTYIGCEPSTCGCDWMLANTKDYPQYFKWLMADPSHQNNTLLNAGLVGGALEAMASFINRMAEECIKLYAVGDVQDMAIINYLAYIEFKDRVSFGPHVNTVFKAFEKDNKVAWFKHK